MESACEKFYRAAADSRRMNGKSVTGVRAVERDRVSSPSNRRIVFETGIRGIVHGEFVMRFGGLLLARCWPILGLRYGSHLMGRHRIFGESVRTYL